MLLTYVDESFDKSTYWLVGLVVPEHAVASLTNALDLVVAKAAAGYPGISPRAELHGHELFHGHSDWRALEAMPRARIGVYNDAFAAVASHDVDILLRGVAVQQLHTAHPHDITLEYLLERLNDHAESRRNSQPTLVIADEVERTSVHRDNLWRF